MSAWPSAAMSSKAGRRFVDRVAIVTGASRGIGLAIAQRIVDEGGKVCITARKREPLEAAVVALGADVAVGVAGSADDAAHQDNAIATTLERFGRIDILVNNTGINPVYGPLLDADVRAMHRILAVNVLGTLAWVRKVHASCFGQHGGVVVNVGSVAGVRPARGIGFYGASKAAVAQLTGQLALELAPTVRVNGIAPAVVRTRFAGALYEGREEDVIAEYPLGRLGRPEDVAAATAFLAGDDASWITGHVLVVDGGLLLGGGV